MAGHNKWSKVKHIKGAVDAKRGKLFTKLIKEITVAARLGGGSLDGNPRLRSAVTAAKSNSMPKDNIDRAIKKGTGNLDGGTIEELVYEGYGAGGVAVLVQATTDNKNRTVADLRKMFKSNGGNLGESGSVLWMFDECGQLLFEAEKHPEEKVMEVALDAGAKDIVSSDGMVEVLTESTELYKIKDAFDKVGMDAVDARLGFVAKTPVPVNDKEVGEKLFKMLEEIEDHDDVQKVFANFEMEDSLLAELSG